MDEDRFNISARKYLKQLGVTSQRAIEKAVRDALASGKLKDAQEVQVKTTLEMSEIGLVHVVEGTIDVG